MGDGDAGEGEEVRVQDVWGKCGHCGYRIDNDAPDGGKQGYLDHDCSVSEDAGGGYIVYGPYTREVGTA